MVIKKRPPSRDITFAANNSLSLKQLFTCLMILALGVIMPPSAEAENDGLDGGGGASPSLFERIKGGVVHGAEAAGGGIRHGAEATAHGIERGFDATVRGVERGVQATSRGLHKVSQKLGLSDMASE